MESIGLTPYVKAEEASTIKHFNRSKTRRASIDILHLTDSNYVYVNSSSPLLPHLSHIRINFNPIH
jgi:hypothetical protein